MMFGQKRRLFLGASVGLLAAATGAWLAGRHDTADGLPEDVRELLWTSAFESPQGDTLALADLRGRPLVINFWATWCAPCVEEMPLINTFFRENKAKGWQVVGLAIDQPSRVRQFLTQFPIDYAIGLAGLHGTELTKKLGNQAGGLPFTLVLDARGRVIQRKLGKLTAEDINSWVSSGN
jgi:thiol-disulfide isomerase/thioredoxin